MKVIYEDKDILVVYKPANTLTQSDESGNDGIL